MIEQGIEPNEEARPYIYEVQDGQMIKVKEYTYETHRTIDVEIADKSVEYINNQARSGKPFFLFIPWTRPHFPNYTFKEFEGKQRFRV